MINKLLKKSGFREFLNGKFVTEDSLKIVEFALDGFTWFLYFTVILGVILKVREEKMYMSKFFAPA